MTEEPSGPGLQRDWEGRRPLQPLEPPSSGDMLALLGFSELREAEFANDSEAVWWGRGVRC